MSLQKILSDYQGLSTETYHFNQSKHRKWFCAWKNIYLQDYHFNCNQIKWAPMYSHDQIYID